MEQNIASDILTALSNGEAVISIEEDDITSTISNDPEQTASSKNEDSITITEEHSSHTNDSENKSMQNKLAAHFSHVKNIHEFTLDSVDDRAKKKLYLCPLCPAARYTPRSDKKIIQSHLFGHLNHGIHFKDIKVCQCFQPCIALYGHRGHFHCPVCEQTCLSKTVMQDHLVGHLLNINIQIPHPDKLTACESNDDDLSSSLNSDEADLSQDDPGTAIELTDSTNTCESAAMSSEDRSTFQQLDTSSCMEVSKKDKKLGANEQEQIDSVQYSSDAVINSVLHAVFRSGASLKPHRTHGRTEMYQCLLCPELKFNTYRIIERHIVSLHKNRSISYKDTLLYPCNRNCEQKKTSTRSHFHCPDCGATLSTNVGMRYHLTQHLLAPPQTNTEVLEDIKKETCEDAGAGNEDKNLLCAENDEDRSSNDDSINADTPADPSLSLEADEKSTTMEDKNDDTGVSQENQHVASSHILQMGAGSTVNLSGDTTISDTEERSLDKLVTVQTADNEQNSSASGQTREMCVASTVTLSDDTKVSHREGEIVDKLVPPAEDILKKQTPGNAPSDGTQIQKGCAETSTTLSGATSNSDKEERNVDEFVLPGEEHTTESSDKPCSNSGRKVQNSEHAYAHMCIDDCKTEAELNKSTAECESDSMENPNESRVNLQSSSQEKSSEVSDADTHNLSDFKDRDVSASSVSVNDTEGCGTGESSEKAKTTDIARHEGTANRKENDITSKSSRDMISDTPVRTSSRIARRKGIIADTPTDQEMEVDSSGPSVDQSASQKTSETSKKTPLENIEKPIRKRGRPRKFLPSLIQQKIEEKEAKKDMERITSKTNTQNQQTESKRRPGRPRKIKQAEEALHTPQPSVQPEPLLRSRPRRLSLPPRRYSPTLFSVKKTENESELEVEQREDMDIQDSDESLDMEVDNKVNQNENQVSNTEVYSGENQEQKVEKGIFMCVSAKVPVTVIMDIYGNVNTALDDLQHRTGATVAVSGEDFVISGSIEKVNNSHQIIQKLLTEKKKDGKRSKEEDAVFKPISIPAETSTSENTSSGLDQPIESPVKRGRGRPKKNSLQAHPSPSIIKPTPVKPKDSPPAYLANKTDRKSGRRSTRAEKTTGENLDEVKEEPDSTECQFHCPACSFHSVSFSELYTHVNSKHHVDSETFVHKRHGLRCPKCDFSTMHEETLLDHVKRFHVTKNQLITSINKVGISCKLCPYVGKNRKALHRHLKRFHIAESDQKCEHCNYVGTHLALSHHVRRYHRDRCHKCSICKKVFTRKHDLLIHKKTHYVNKLLQEESELVELLDGSYKCEKCGQVLHRLHEYNQHKKQHLKPDCNAPFECEQCDYVTKDKYDFRDHVARKHGERKYECNICGKKYAVAFDLKQHFKFQHTSAGTSVCHLCGKTFRNPRYLTTHMQRHTGVKKHFCSICNKGFFERCKMKEHMEVHKRSEERKKKYSCPVCGKEFLSRAYCRDHQNIHTGVRPYKCKVCGKTFASSTGLTKHALFHGNQKPYKCPYCDKAFRMKAKLNYHLVIHTGQSRHVCSKCNKVYTQHATLKRHKCKPVLWKQQDPSLVHHMVEAVYQSTDQPLEGIAGELQFVGEAQDVMTVSMEDNVPHELYMCSICDKIFQDWDLIQSHMQQHGDQDDMQQHEEQLLHLPQPEEVQMDAGVTDEGQMEDGDVKVDEDNVSVIEIREHDTGEIAASLLADLSQCV